MFQKIWSILVVTVFVAVLAACAGTAPQAVPPAAQEEAAEPAQPAAETGQEAEAPPASGGGTVRIGWNGSPDTLNPGTAILEEAYYIFELVYDAMYELELDGSFRPSLAESVDVSDDGKVWTFKIRPDVTFHDGQPLTARDVAFSYNFYKSHEDFPYMNAYTPYFESIEAPDDVTVVLTLSEAIGNMESQLVFLFVLPEHIWAEHAGETAAEFENLEMIGSGPFKMVEYKQNEFVRLAANKEFFGGAPKVDEVIFQTFGNPDALVQAIVTGQVDMIREMPHTAVPTLRNTPNVEVVIGTPRDPSIRDFVFNQLAPENCPEGSACTGHPALRDRNVRLALAHATDLQNLIDVAELGLATPGITLIPNSLGDWYNSNLKPYEFDIAKANQILDEAGYQDTDGDGVREMPDGSQPLDFRLNWPNDIPAAPRTAELLGQSWGQIGVKLQPQALDPDALTAACCPNFDFDLMIWGWGSDPDPSLLLGVMTTDEIPTGSSETGYSNPEYDQLFRQQAVELDHDKRRELVWKMQEIAHNDVVYLTYYQQEVQAYRTDRFKGWITDAPTLILHHRSSLNVVEPVQ